MLLNLCDQRQAAPTLVSLSPTSVLTEATALAPEVLLPLETRGKTTLLVFLSGGHTDAVERTRRMGWASELAGCSTSGLSIQVQRRQICSAAPRSRARTLQMLPEPSPRDLRREAATP